MHVYLLQLTVNDGHEGPTHGKDEMTINSEKLTAEEIAALLPPSWAYTFVDLKAALHYFHPERTIL